MSRLASYSTLRPFATTQLVERCSNALPIASLPREDVRVCMVQV